MPDPSVAAGASAGTRAGTGAETAPDFVYSIYIGAPAPRVWDALIDRDLTHLYWGHHNKSAWTRGARWEHIRTTPGGEVDIVGTVLEIDPPKRLVVTWVGPSNEGDVGKTSRVTYRLTPNGDETLLMVTHSELEPGSEMNASVREGWVAVLSNMKTLLETGKQLEILSRWEETREQSH